MFSNTFSEAVEKMLRLASIEKTVTTLLTNFLDKSVKDRKTQANFGEPSLNFQSPIDQFSSFWGDGGGS